MLLLEAVVKFSSLGLLCGLGALVYRDARQVPALRYSLLLIAAMASVFLTTGSEELRINGDLAVPLRLFDMFNAVFIWWLGLSLFDDEFKLGKREWLVAFLYLCVALPSRLYYLGFDTPWHPVLNLPPSIISLLMMGHLAWRAFVGHREDLIERRRRVRIWFAIAVASVLVMSIVAERLAVHIGVLEAETIWITYMFTFPLSLWALLWLTRMHPEMLAFKEDNAAVVDDSQLDPRDRAAYQRLVEIMEKQRAYTNQGLTIGSLARQVGIPSHQLRNLINKSMGYRNFSSFLNFYRIAEVKRSLAVLENRRIPILTLAMDAGFSSLAPFNRAFKATEGQTPTEFRTNLLLEEGSESTD